MLKETPPQLISAEGALMIVFIMIVLITLAMISVKPREARQ
jgi:hypothetical protein